MSKLTRRTTKQRTRRTRRASRDQDALNGMAQRLATQRMIFTMLEAGGHVLREEFDFTPEQSGEWGRKVLERMAVQFHQQTAEITAATEQQAARQPEPDVSA